MNKLVVRFLVVGFFGMGALHAAEAGPEVVEDSRQQTSDAGGFVPEISPEVAALANKLAADLELGADVIDQIAEVTGQAAPAGRRSACREAFAAWYRSAFCHRTAAVLTNPGVQGALQAALIVLGTTLVVSYLIVIPTALLAIGGIAAKLVQRQQQLDAIARGEVPASKTGGYDDGSETENLLRERTAFTAQLLETTQGRAYTHTFNRSMERLGRSERIVAGEPIPDMLVSIISAVVSGISPVAAAGDSRGVGAGARSREDYAVKADWQGALRAACVSMPADATAV